MRGKTREKRLKAIPKLEQDFFEDFVPGIHTELCKECAYWHTENHHSFRCCAYILIEGHSRRCSPENCKKFRPLGKLI